MENYKKGISGFFNHEEYERFNRDVEKGEKHLPAFGFKPAFPDDFIGSDEA